MNHLGSVDDSGPWPVKIEGKWGYFHPDAGLVIDPRYDSAQYFREGLAAVCLEPWEVDARIPPLYAVIDPCGTIVIPPFRGVPACWGFSSGLLGVLEIRPIGGDIDIVGEYYLDRNGNRLHEGRFQSAGYFRDGRAPVRINQLWGYIDLQGEVVIPPRFEHGYAFSDGYALVEEPGSDRKGLIDRDGNYVLGPMRELRYGLAEGLVVARSERGFHFLDTNGREAFPGLFFRHGLTQFHSGMAAFVEEENGPVGFIDRNGNRYEPCYSEILADFSEGLCPVEYPDGRRTYIDRKLNEVIDISGYSKAGQFRGGLAQVWNGEKLGYINTHGKHVWEPRL